MALFKAITLDVTNTLIRPTQMVGDQYLGALLRCSQFADTIALDGGDSPGAEKVAERITSAFLKSYKEWTIDVPCFGGATSYPGLGRPLYRIVRSSIDGTEASAGFSSSLSMRSSVCVTEPVNADFDGVKEPRGPRSTSLSCRHECEFCGDSGLSGVLVREILSPGDHVDTETWWLNVVHDTLARSGYDEELIKECLPGVFPAVFNRFAAGGGGWEVLPGAHRMLRFLHENGLCECVGIISNTDERVYAVLEEFELSPFIDFVITSRELGAEKPCPSVFRKALHHATKILCERDGSVLSLEPKSVLHIGDNLHKDTLAAMDCGFHAVRLLPPRTTERIPHTDGPEAMAPIEEDFAFRVSSADTGRPFLEARGLEGLELALRDLADVNGATLEWYHEHPHS